MDHRNSCVMVVGLVFLVCIFSIISGQWFLVSAVEPPTKLRVYAGPSKVLADKGVYESILVQLLDKNNKPARAPEDIVVSLSSSRTDIGSVDPTITIPSWETCASANFYSTYTPGPTTITAAASGYDSGQASVTTVGPIPSKLAVYCFPPTLPADSKTYKSIVVQLQDPSGNPARAPIGDVNVTLSSSNTNVGTVDNSTLIRSGSTYAIANFYATNMTGSTTITAIASGYTSGDAIVKTSSVGPALKLRVYVGPPKITAAGFVHESICVELQDAVNNVARAPENITVALSSSDVSVGTVDPTVTIEYGNTHGLAKFYSTYKSGSTTITAAASGYDSGQASMTTLGPIPSKLAVYPLPPMAPADKGTYSIAVQLQDASGVPARDPIGSVAVILSSSNTAIGNVDSTTTIDFGLTYSKTEFYSTYTAGSVTITAMTAGYASGQASINTYVIDPPLTVTVTAHPNSTTSNEQTTIHIYVTDETLTPPGAVPGATVELASDGGGNFSQVTDERTGTYMAVFTTPTVETSTVLTITATASNPGYAGGEAEVALTVNPTGVGGDILISVQDLDGNPISGASVISTSQPDGQSALSGTTDITGYVAFENVKAGSYTIRVNKTGYDTWNQQIIVTDGQTTTDVVAIAPSTPGFLDSILIWIVLAVILAVAAIVTVMILKRRSSGAGIISRKEYDEYYGARTDERVSRCLKALSDSMLS
jgi:hypothetical protein